MARLAAKAICSVDLIGMSAYCRTRIPSNQIPLSRPDIDDSDIRAVTDVLRSGQLSLGPAVPAFEQALAAYVGVKHAVAVNSGTSALHLCLRALGIGDGDDVITTPFSFIASANCMLFERAVPIFVDIEPTTYCIDVSRIEAAITPKTKAILAVDVFGYLCDWDALRAIATKHDLALIEDSCEALGTAKGGKKAGTFGDCGTFAFYPNKQMTTGEGGMLVTDRDDIAAAARAMRNQGRDPGAGWLEHKVLGYNYRLSDIHAALGSSQLARLPSFIEKREHVVTLYRHALAELEGDIVLPADQPGTDISWFVYVIRLADRFALADRDALVSFLREHGVACNTYFPSIHLQPLYRDRGHANGEFPVTEHVSDRTIALPFFTDVMPEHVATVAKTLKDGLRTLSPAS